MTIHNTYRARWISTAFGDGQVMRVLAPLLCLALSGCAAVSTGSTLPQKDATARAVSASSSDPWERSNRKVFAFNDSLDAAVLKPVAEGYRAVVPQIVRAGIDNFLGNIGDVGSTANHVLQGKLQNGLEMGMRVLVNTTFGLGGALDPATEMRLPRRTEDFGQTLGIWGVGTGPFVVLPVLGPSTLRDSFALPVDLMYAPSAMTRTSAAAYSITALSAINTRSNLLPTTQLLDQVALDRYTFIRDTWLQRRRSQVNDETPSAEDDEGESMSRPQ